ncbi:putative reverse transcriptase domain-containing protein [Tanacetum coccineum]
MVKSSPTSESSKVVVRSGQEWIVMGFGGGNSPLVVMTFIDVGSLVFGYVDIKMLLVKGSGGGRGVKKKNKGVAAKDVVSPSVIDEPVVMDKHSSLVDTSIHNVEKTSLSSYPPLPMQGSTPAGNTSGKSSYANVTGAPSRKALNFCILFTPRGNEVDVVVPVESIRAISESSMNDLNAMLENGPWFIRNHQLILKKWNPDVNLLKEDVGNVLVWVKLHGVLVTAFNEDGLSAIATKLGTPLMLDSYTFDICLQSWGREGFYTCTIHVEYEWKPPRPVSKKLTSNTSGNKKKSVEPTKELIIDGKVTLVDDDVKPLKKVDYLGDHDSEDEIESIDNDMARFMASKRIGFATKSLLEQWSNSYENGDYDENPYDDDMYEGQDFPDTIQDICDNLDIRVRGRKKK